jgi:transposase-like protein
MKTRSKQRRSFSAEMKARIALEAIKGQKTIQEIASHYGVHPNQVTNWKRQAIDGVPAVFADRRSQPEMSESVLKAELYQQIGQLQVEVDWLKKKSGLSR